MFTCCPLTLNDHGNYSNHITTNNDIFVNNYVTKFLLKFEILEINDQHYLNSFLALVTFKLPSHVYKALRKQNKYCSAVYSSASYIVEQYFVLLLLINSTTLKTTITLKESLSHSSKVTIKFDVTLFVRNNKNNPK